jgi:hypothetical protein
MKKEVRTVELLEITEKAFRYYRKKVRGNQDITYDQARKKLTRNVLLAKKLPPRSEEDVQKGNVLYHYGNLHLLVKDGWVIHIKNHRQGNEYTGWELDRFKYVDLSRKLQIVE